MGRWQAEDRPSLGLLPWDCRVSGCIGLLGLPDCCQSHLCTLCPACIPDPCLLPDLGCVGCWLRLGVGRNQLFCSQFRRSLCVLVSPVSRPAMCAWGPDITSCWRGAELSHRVREEARSPGRGEESKAQLSNSFMEACVCSRPPL